jgi:hypothetical protein
MYPTVNTSPSTQWEELPLESPPDAQQLDNIKTHLDLILMALEALAKIGSEAMLQAAQALKVDDLIADRIALWRLRQSNPLRQSSGGRKKLDVEEARALVLIVGYLARQHQELMRRAVSLLEQVTAAGQPPHRSALLGDYLDNFSQMYQERMEQGESLPPSQLTQIAFKLMIDLLFYSGPNGHRRLWLALLDACQYPS